MGLALLIYLGCLCGMYLKIEITLLPIYTFFFFRCLKVAHPQYFINESI